MVTLQIRCFSAQETSFLYFVVYAYEISPAFYRQLFLTDGALHLLVVDLHKFDQDPLSRGDAIYIWLDSLLCRVPTSVVLVVATHTDAFGDDREREAAALGDLETAIKEHMEAKQKVHDSAFFCRRRHCRSRHEPSEKA